MRSLAVLPLFAAALVGCQTPQLDVTLAGEGDARLCVITRGGAINPCCTTPGQTARCKAPGVAAGTAFEVQLFRAGQEPRTWTLGDNVFQGRAASPSSFAFTLTPDSLAGAYTLPTGENARAAWPLR